MQLNKILSYVIQYFHARGNEKRYNSTSENMKQLKYRKKQTFTETRWNPFQFKLIKEPMKRQPSAILLGITAITCFAGCDESSSSIPTSDTCTQDPPHETCVCQNDAWQCDPICPNECPDSCDQNGNCPNYCPDECLDECDQNGKCPVSCPDECPDECDQNGKCPVSCPNECPDECDKNGKCPVSCPDECPDECDQNGNCPNNCPDECPNSCNEAGECGYCGNELVTVISFSFPEIDILVPGSVARTESSSSVSIKTEKTTYNLETAPCASDIVLESSHTDVVTVAPGKVDGVIKAKFKSVHKGTATLTASLKNTNIKGTTKIHVLDLDNFNDDLTAIENGEYIHLHQGPLTLKYNAHTQGFDFYNSDYSFYTQPQSSNRKLGDVTLSGDIMHVFRYSHSDKKTSNSMILYNSGHGQNLIIEKTNDGHFAWLSNYGTLKKNGDSYDLTAGKNKNTEGYKFSQTISRVKLAGNTSYYPEDIDEHYYYSDNDGDEKSYYHSFEPMMDAKNNRFGFRAYYYNPNDGTNRMHVKIFNLSKAKALAAKSVTLPRPIDRVEKDGNLKSNQHPTVKVKDLSDLKAEYESTPGILEQGAEIENGLLYTITGYGDNMTKTSGHYQRHSYIKIRVFTYNGKKVGEYFLTNNGATEGNRPEPNENTKVLYLNNNELDAMINQRDSNGNESLYHIGYFESEGIRVSDGIVYINLTAPMKKPNDTATYWKHFVFKYDLTK